MAHSARRRSDSIMRSDSDPDGVTGNEEVARLQRAMDSGTITREAFVARVAALGVSITGIGALFGAGDASAASARAARRSRAASSTLRVVDVGNGTAETLNPHLQSSPIDGMRI